MGSKSSSAPAPDPRLIDAQIRSMGIQDDSIQRLLANSESMLPLQKEQMQFGLDTSRKAYDQSQADRTFALGRRDMLSGVQDKIAGDANNFNEASRAADLTGQGVATVRQGAANQQASAMRNAGRYGLSSSSMSNAFARNSLDVTKNELMAANMARGAAHAEGLQLTDRASNALAGYPSMASGLSGSGAGYGSNGLNMANAGLAGMNSGFGAAGGLAGQMGSNATGMYGAMGSYKNGADQIAASNDPTNMMLGAATGVAMAYAMPTKPSDRRLKTDIRAVGRLDNGLTVYRYRYKAGGPVHIGVMADEVAKVKPEAYVKGGAGGYDAVDYGKL